VDPQRDVAGRVGVGDDDVDRERGHVEAVDPLQDGDLPRAPAAAARALRVRDAAAEDHQRAEVDAVLDALAAGEDQRLVGAADVEEVADEEEEEEHACADDRGGGDDLDEGEVSEGEQAGRLA
jgi:hypothetical protein